MEQRRKSKRRKGSLRILLFLCVLLVGVLPMAAVSVLYLIYLHILVIYRYIVKLCEADAIEACCEAEYSVDTALKLEIWLELLCAERVLRLLILL